MIRTEQHQMKFFHPLSWYPPGRIDALYDFESEKTMWPDRQADLENRLCQYEYMNKRLCDGILVSRTLLESTVKVLKDTNGTYYTKSRRGISKTILGTCGTGTRNLIAFADPGTWSYVNKFKLPNYLYDTDDLIDYYNDLQYDLAGSVDWPIVDKIVIVDENKKRKHIELDKKTKEHRRKTTLELAKDFIEKCNKRDGLNFIPFGTIQGYSVETYLDSLREILKCGYKYIAIGGLPSYSEKKVLELLPLLWKEIQKSGQRPGIHLYGRYPSPKAVREFLRYGVTSFDSTSAHAMSSGTAKSCYIHPDFADPRKKKDSPAFKNIGIKLPHRRSRVLTGIRKKHPNLYLKIVKESDILTKLFNLYNKTGSKKTLRKLSKLYARVELRIEKSRKKKKIPPEKVKAWEQHCFDDLNSKVWEYCDCIACKEAKANIIIPQKQQRINHIHSHNSYILYTRLIKEQEIARKEIIYPKYDWTEVIRLNRKKNRRQAIIKEV